LSIVCSPNHSPSIRVSSVRVLNWILGLICFIRPQTFKIFFSCIGFKE